MRIALLLDDRELFLERLAYLGRNAARIAPRCAVPGEIAQMTDRRLARRYRLMRIIVSEVAELERDAIGEPHGLRDGVGRVAEQACHLRRRLQVPLGIGFQELARLVDRHMLADAGDDVLKLAPRRLVIEHVVDGQQLHARLGRQHLEPLQPPPVVAMMQHRSRQPDAAGRQRPQRFERRAGFGERAPRRRHHDEQQAFVSDVKIACVVFLREIVQEQRAFALGGALLALRHAQLAVRQKLAKPSIGGAVGRIGEDVRGAVGEHQPGADQKLGLLLRQPRILERRIGAHHAGQRVAVRDADSLVGIAIGRDSQVFRPRGPAQEGEVRRHRDLGIRRLVFQHRDRRVRLVRHGFRRALVANGFLRLHANSPCMYQRGGNGSRA